MSAINNFESTKPSERSPLPPSREEDPVGFLHNDRRLKLALAHYSLDRHHGKENSQGELVFNVGVPIDSYQRPLFGLKGRLTADIVRAQAAIKLTDSSITIHMKPEDSATSFAGLLFSHDETPAHGFPLPNGNQYKGFVAHLDVTGNQSELYGLVDREGIEHLERIPERSDARLGDPGLADLFSNAILQAASKKEPVVPTSL